jgi:hypothetical protein
VTESVALPPVMRSHSILIPAPTTSLTDRLIKLAADAHKSAAAAPAGPKREAFLRAALLSENALHIQLWITYRDLRAHQHNPPKSK